MKTQEYRPGDYACVDITTGKSPAGLFMDWEIRHMTHSQYNHAFIITSEDGDIVEATPYGAREASIHQYDGEKIIFSNTILTDAQRNGIVNNALYFAAEKVPYGFLDIAYLGLALNGIKWEWLLDRVLTETRLICSQLVAQCGFNVGVKEWLCGQEDPQLVTPGMLAALG